MTQNKSLPQAWEQKSKSVDSLKKSYAEKEAKTKQAMRCDAESKIAKKKALAEWFQAYDLAEFKKNQFTVHTPTRLLYFTSESHAQLNVFVPDFGNLDLTAQVVPEAQTLGKREIPASWGDGCTFDIRLDLDEANHVKDWWVIEDSMKPAPERKLLPGEPAEPEDPHNDEAWAQYEIDYVKFRQEHRAKMTQTQAG